MNKKQIIITIVVAVIVGAAGFAGGMQYQKSKTPAFAGRSGINAGVNGVAGAAGARRFAAGGNNFVTGSVLSQNGQQMTVQNRSGGSLIVILPASAQIGKFAAASSTDISVGSVVTVTGTTNSDGSMTAQTVQVRPAGSPGPGGPGQSAQPGTNQ
jgi:hypothetical protein